MPDSKHQPKTQADVDRVKHLYKKGRTYQQIVDETRFSMGTVFKMINGEYVPTEDREGGTK